MSSKNLPKIEKAKLILGKSLLLIDASESDAAFIHQLHNTAMQSHYFFGESMSLEKQQELLRRYAYQNDKAWFIIESLTSERLGTVELFDAKMFSYCWGNWILKKNVPKTTAIESALMIYAYAIDYLGFKTAHFYERKNNEDVIRFHERFGATRIDENEEHYLYSLDAKNITRTRRRYARFLPDGIVVFD